MHNPENWIISKSLKQAAIVQRLLKLSESFKDHCNNVYFEVIGQAFHELWQFKARYADSRNLIHFIPDSVFWIMRV